MINNFITKELVSRIFLSTIINISELHMKRKTEMHEPLNKNKNFDGNIANIKIPFHVEGLN